MDALQFDGYTSYSDSSAPRTPSPNQPIMNFNLKPVLLDEPVRNIFADNHHDDGAVVVPAENAPYPWAPPPSSAPFHFSHNNNSRGSLLQELYDHDIQEQQHHQHLTPEFPSAEPQFVGDNNWQQQQQQQQQQSRPHDFQMMRRATFPYVRHDREDGLPMQPIPQFFQQQPQHPQHHQQQHHGHHSTQLHSFGQSRHDSLYSDSLPLSDPNSLNGESFISSLNSSPHSSYHEFDDSSNIKLEDNSSMMMPSQSFYRQPPSSAGSSSYPMNMSYVSPHTGLPVQHTDDAASKETQYLRRRCFNCHTTEPPSWRRSTLNPGKIVCNKCGLYERTHLRPRPLRFDELRAGNKARKQGKRTLSPKSRVANAAAGANGTNSQSSSVSPPAGAGGPMVKKEPREFGIVRRSSVSSQSSVHSGSGASDWDDNVSVYSSSGSAPPTSFNSPNVSSFPLSRDASSSPPQTNVNLNSGIRLPNASLSDIAGMSTTQSPQMHGSPGLPHTPNLPPPSLPHTPNLPSHTPRKAHTSPEAYFSPPAATISLQQQEDYFMRRTPAESPAPQATPEQQQLLSSPLPTPVIS